MKNFFRFHTEFTFIHELFTDFIFPLNTQFFGLVSTVEMTDWSIGDVTEEKHSEDQLTKRESNAQAKDQENEGSKFGTGLPVDFLEARVLNIADHEISDAEHQRRHQDGETTNIEAVQDQYKRSNHSSCGRNREA